MFADGTLRWCLQLKNTPMIILHSEANIEMMLKALASPSRSCKARKLTVALHLDSVLACCMLAETWLTRAAQ